MRIRHSRSARRFVARLSTVKLSYANITATLALLLASLGGASATANQVAEITKLKKRSVGAREIKPGAIRSSHVRNGSLLARDFRPGQLPAGPPGTAKAWGRVSSSGVVAVGQNLTASKVAGSTGRYCIGVTPPLQMTIPILSNEFTTTPDWGDVQASNEWETGVAGNPQCPQGMFLVVRQGGDGGFYVVIP